MDQAMATGQEECVDVLVVGAGFAGLYALHRLRQQGLKVLVLERAGGVGGTWYWNRYPGARCDVESLEYSYSFDEALQREWVWTERYAAQPEILRYLDHVADRFDLRRDIRFDTNVVAAQFDESDSRWRIRTEDGGCFVARYFVAATGCLSIPNRPTYPGQERFEGSIHYTSSWPHEGVDFTGKRVAVIGTGSSGIQSIPIIAEQADHLTVFQRTASFSVPACNRPLTADEVAKVKAAYRSVRQHNLDQPFAFNLYMRDLGVLEATAAEREREFETRWNAFGGLQFVGAFSDILLNAEANREAAEFIRRKIHQIVEDPATAELLTPRDHAVACKRLCSDTGYYETFNRPSVDLVDLRSQPISAIEPRGIRFGDQLLDVDMIVYATGFDAMTGALLGMNIVGRGGRRLRDQWEHGPQTHLGLMSAGFPNLFMVTGPGSPSVLTNMVMAIENHVDWIADCVAYLDNEDIAAIEPTLARQEAWMETVSAVANSTQFTGCNSWYAGSNIPGKPQAFAVYVGFPDYRKIIAAVANAGYAEFSLSREQMTESVR